MTALALINPHAGGGRAARSRDAIESGLREAVPGIDVVWTTSPHHATEAARVACASGCTRLVALGGDGTIGEVVNGMIDPDRPQPVNVELSLIQFGTGGDLQRSLWSQTSSWRDALARLASPERAPLDVGIAQFASQGGDRARCFVNAASLGVSAHVAHHVNHLAHLKRTLGASAFAVGAVRGIASARPFRARVTRADGSPESVELFAAAMCNGRVFGGGMRIAPTASLADGLLDVVLIRATSRWRALMALPRLYRGTHLELPFVEHHRVRAFEITTESPVPLECDGDAMLDITPARFAILAGAVPLRGWSGVPA